MPPPSLIERYRAAAERAAFAPWARHWTPDRLLRLARNVTVTPEWVDGDRWWYRKETPAGHSFVLVDPDTASTLPAFDHERLAALLADATGRVVDPGRLPFDRFEYATSEGAPDLEVIRFERDGATWRCDLRTGACAPDDRPLAPRHRPASRRRSP